MTPFEFSDRTLAELERVQGARGVGRGKIDRRGNRQAARALGSIMRAPHELAFAGIGRVSDVVANLQSPSNSQRNVQALQKIDRVARGAPQVVVKITSRIHGAPSTVGAFTYAGRIGMSDKEPIGIETSEGKHLVSAHDMLLLAREWQQWEQADETRRKGATAIAMVFSMPPGADPEMVREAVRDFAEDDMANRRWVMALHTDEAHPHVHLIIAGRDNDGRRFNPNREFLQHCRERFAQNMRAWGIEADATLRMSRGYPSKKDPSPVLKMRERGVTPEADQGRIAMIRGQDAGAGARLADRKRARSRTIENAATVRAVYQRAITELEVHGGGAEAGRAKALRMFVDGLPDLHDARAEIVEHLKAGKGLPKEYEKDVELERLKSRVQHRAEDQRAAMLERIDRAATKITSLSAELKNDPLKSTPGAGEPTAEARIRALTERLRNSATDRPDASARLEKLPEQLREIERQRNHERDRSRARDKDREGPSR